MVTIVYQAICPKCSSILGRVFGSGRIGVGIELCCRGCKLFPVLGPKPAETRQPGVVLRLETDLNHPRRAMRSETSDEARGPCAVSS